MLLSRRTQAWIIGRMMNGEEVSVDPTILNEPWSRYAEWMLSGPVDETPDERLAAFVRDWVGQVEEHEVNLRLICAEVEEGDRYPSIDEYLAQLPELEWLWKSWIPRGLITLLAGDSGTGKSYLALELAHRLAAGSEFPDGTLVNGPGVALYVDAENTPQILKQRLIGWTQAEQRRLFLLRPEEQRMVIDLSGFEDRDRLLDMAYRVGADLVVIDSYGASTLKGENAKEDVQANLAFLSRMALDYHCAVLILHHLRKRSSLHVSLPRIPMTIDSIRGSSHIPAMARNVLAMQWVGSGRQIDRNGPRRLEVIKSNLERYPPALGVWFEPHPGDASVARLRFGEAPKPERVATTAEQCAAWLLELLETQGPLPASEVVTLGMAAGYSERTIFRARRQLGDEVENTKGWRDPGNTWAAASGDVDEDEAAENPLDEGDEE